MSVTYRTLPWRRSDGWAMLFLACVFLSTLVWAPGQPWASVGGAILVLALEAFVVWRTVLTITPDEVVYLDVAGPAAVRSPDLAHAVPNGPRPGSDPERRWRLTSLAAVPLPALSSLVGESGQRRQSAHVRVSLPDRTLLVKRGGWAGQLGS
jgi:hypothetical protein